MSSFCCCSQPVYLSAEIKPLHLPFIIYLHYWSKGSLEGYQPQMFSVLLTYLQEGQVFLWVLFWFFCFWFLCLLEKIFLGGGHVLAAILLINLKKSEPGEKYNTRFDFTMSLSFPEPKQGTHWMKRIRFSIVFFLKNKRWLWKSVTSFSTFDNVSKSYKVLDESKSLDGFF